MKCDHGQANDPLGKKTDKEALAEKWNGKDDPGRRHPEERKKIFGKRKIRNKELFTPAIEGKIEAKSTRERRKLEKGDIGRTGAENP